LEAIVIPPAEAQADSPTPAVSSLFSGYSDEPKPLLQYAQLMGLYSLAFVVFLALAKRTGKPIPERVPLGDILLVGVATFKLSRTVSKEVVMSPLRAAFTRFEEKAGEGELNETPRGEGYQRTIGELLTCPFCLGMWVAAFLAYGLVLAPPVTRLAMTILASKALSDTLHLGYTAACKSID
jgi:hypothetical protein